jgi:SAM-dependent methyltransferase
MYLKKYLPFLRSPIDGSELVYENDNLVDGSSNIFPIINSIPRFVEADNYAESFGFQWNIFDQTQIDKFTANNISSERLCKNSGWSNEVLQGKKLLEVGSGAGRFTEIILKTGADVYSIDYSNAVEANWRNNNSIKDFFLAQANIYKLPFEQHFFDYILCFGVIQHTPDVEASFLSLVKHLKPGGEIAIDVYSKNWKSFFYTKYWVRPLTKRIDKNKLLKIIRWYVPKWFPVSSVLLKVPFAGKFLAQVIPIVNYSKQFPFLNKKQLVEWAVLDTFDMLSPAHDHPQSLATLRKWATEANLEILYCGKGGNGYVLRAKK